MHGMGQLLCGFAACCGRMNGVEQPCRCCRHHTMSLHSKARECSLDAPQGTGQCIASHCIRRLHVKLRPCGSRLALRVVWNTLQSDYVHPVQLRFQLKTLPCVLSHGSFTCTWICAVIIGPESVQRVWGVEL
jgi:hypothetical protein